MSFTSRLRWTHGRLDTAPGAPVLTTTGVMACLLLSIAGSCIAPPGVLPSRCGDGFVDEHAGEECDDRGASATCDLDCTLAVCGDGLVNAMAGEECDTAGSTAWCDADCTVARCGDGTIHPEAGETCDDGNVVSGDGCNTDCRTSGACGNGTMDTGETCDHHAMSTANCDSDCTPVTCGDGLVNTAAGEQCDDAGMSAECDHDCTLAVCGDGLVNTIAGEECDTGGHSATCDQNCTIARCGDGVLNTAAGEACDASGVDTMSCDRDCSAVTCGDGTVNAAAGEQCDTAGESALCDADCTAAWCGDGVINAVQGEECEDGNQLDDDGCSSSCLLEPARTRWSSGFGGTGNDGSRAIAVDSAGNVLLTGYFEGTIDFGGGPLASAGSTDIFAVKLDAQGQHLWSRRLGGPWDDFGYGIAADSAGDVLLTGRFDGTVDFGGGPLASAGSTDIFAVKLDAQGQHLWSQRFGGTDYDEGSGIAVDSAGNVLLIGTFNGTGDFGGGPLSSAGYYDAFVVKLDAQGQHLWSQRFGGTSGESGMNIAADSADNVLFTGLLHGTADFGGGPLSTAGASDIFAVELDAQGQHLWSRRLGGPSWDAGFDIAVDGAGNVLLTGYFQGIVDFGGGPLSSAGDYDVFAVKLDAQGQHLWSQRFGGTSRDEGFSIAVDGAGNVLLTGYFQDTAEFGGGSLSSAGHLDVFLVKLDAQGQHLWSRRFGGTSWDEGLSIAVDSASNVLLTGRFYGTADFGGSPLASAGAHDVFAVKLSP